MRLVPRLKFSKDLHSLTLDNFSGKKLSSGFMGGSALFYLLGSFSKVQFGKNKKSWKRANFKLTTSSKARLKISLFKFRTQKERKSCYYRGSGYRQKGKFAFFEKKCTEVFEKLLKLGNKQARRIFGNCLSTFMIAYRDFAANNELQNPSISNQACYVFDKRMTGLMSLGDSFSDPLVNCNV